MEDSNYKPTGVLQLYKEIEDSKMASFKDAKLSPDEWFKSHDVSRSDYIMSEPAKKVRAMILKHFAIGDTTMQKPRVEFNDTSVLQRAQLDEMSWNTYQPNNGEPDAADGVGGWKSKAVRPIIRNKCISIAAHTTARLLFPKIFAADKDSNVQEGASKVMEDLMEWSGEQSNFSFNSLNRVIAAEVYPASIGYTEYAEVSRRIKEVQEDGSWKEKVIIDEELSGFQDTFVPVDQLYIENFYEADIQKQGWLIWRRVRSYSLLEGVYGKCENFKYVSPGVQLIYNDANQAFYQVYDTNLRQEMCEEIIYWNRSQDLKVVMVNGVMLTEHDNPNPRIDKLYPFDKFGYEMINGRCFYYKSLAFKLLPDANIINTLYPMIIDGTYLQIMPAMVNIGGESITSDVIIPGAVTTLSAPDADLRAIHTSTPGGLQAGFSAMDAVAKSIDDSSTSQVMSGQDAGGGGTAYEISRMEQNSNTVLGLFIKMISDHVRQYGRLRLGDILQYLTIGDVDSVTGETELIYKTFILPDQKQGSKNIHKSIKFEGSLPTEPITADEEMNLSMETLAKEGGPDANKQLVRVNPSLFRSLRYKVTINPDVLNPRSEDLERAFKLEIYDRGIANPLIDQELLAKDFLFGAYPRMVKDVDAYVKEAQEQPVEGMPAMKGMMPQAGNSPLAAMGGKQPLPQGASQTL